LKKKVKGKNILWDKKGFYKVSFVLKDCSKMEKRDRIKTRRLRKSWEGYEWVLSM
jgi:hypothetical protein